MHEPRVGQGVFAMKRVAFVAPYLPAPENSGGRIRMAQLARALSRTSEVELFACGGAAEFERERHGRALASFTRCQVRGRTPSLRWGSSDPERVKSATPARLAWDLYRAHRAQPFDAVVASHSYAMALAEVARGAAIVLDEHNVESAYAAATASARAQSAERERAKLQQWEQRCWRSASAVTCVSEADAAIVRAARPEGVTVIENGVAIEGVRFVRESERRAAGRREVLFVGLMSFGPNEQGARFLAGEVMPRVWKVVPSARLVLCGRQPSAAVAALASERVEVTGTVENVGVYLDRARVLCVPLWHGAGSSLKAVEALASGARVVSTPVGMRGVRGAIAGRTHDEAEDAAAFAAAIVRAFDAHDDGRSEAARALATEFDWAAIGARFDRVVSDAAAWRTR